MPQTFRPVLRHWISRLALPAALVGWAGYLAAYHLIDASFIIFIYAATQFFVNWPPIWQREVRLDDQGLFARLGKKTVRILWNDVLAAWQIKQARGNPLQLSSEKGTVAIPLELFDSRAIWECVQRHVPPEALESDAFTRSPEYKAQMAKAQSLLNDVQEPLSAGYHPPIIFGALSAVFLVVALWISIGLAVGAPCLGPIALLTGWQAISCLSYRVQMTSQTVTVVDLWKRRAIRWDEVDCIEHDFGWHRFVLRGCDKRLAVVDLQSLTEKDRPEMVAMLRAQIEHRHIELRHRERALFTGSHNVAAGRSA